MNKRPIECNTMSEIRIGIDKLDEDLMYLLVKRMHFIDRAAEIKQQIAMPARIDLRVEEVVQNARKNAVEIGFDPCLAENIWRQIIEWSIKREEEAMKNSEVITCQRKL